MCLGGCSGETETVYVEVVGQCDDVPSLQDTEASNPEDTNAGPDDAEGEILEDTQAADVNEGGIEVDGNRMKLDPAELDGLFIYGLGVEPGTALASVGNTVVGAIAMSKPSSVSRTLRSAEGSPARKMRG